MLKTLAAALLVAGWLVAIAVTPTSAQRGANLTVPDLPPITHTCPIHPDVVEAKPGTCPMCQRTLVPVRLGAAWTCPVHAVVMEDDEGKCRICRRDLIPVTVSLTWTCPANPKIDEIERGTCADGSRMVLRRTPRPHGDHNPKHGGQFFMAPDNWHHLEGVYPSERVFRLYLYDDYSRPLPADQMRLVKGRVVTKEVYDAATRKATEQSAFELRPARNGAYLEARIDTATLPATMAAKVRFKSDSPEYRFDFTFRELSKDLSSPAPASSNASASRPAAAPRPAPAAKPETPAAKPEAAAAAPPKPTPERASPPAPVAAPPSAPPPPPPAAAETVAEIPEAVAGTTLADIDPSQVNLPIPGSVQEILAQLKSRNEQIGALIERGEFGAVWVPAFRAKDLAVALEPHVAHLTPETRQVGEPALHRLVRTAWLLDALGDIGNREQLADAYTVFGASVADVVKSFATMNH